MHIKPLKKIGFKYARMDRAPLQSKGIVKHIKTVAKRIRKADAFVVLGIGGSALGTNALFNSLCHLHHNELKKSKRKAPKLYVEDNIDPVRMKELLDVLDLDKTIFNVISKSGSTSETMSQFLIIYKMLKDLYGENAKIILLQQLMRKMEILSK